MIGNLTQGQRDSATVEMVSIRDLSSDVTFGGRF
jgi:hypothetical protein